MNIKKQYHILQMEYGRKTAKIKKKEGRKEGRREGRKGEREKERGETGKEGG